MLSLYFSLNVLALIAITVFHFNDLNGYKKYPLLIPLAGGLIFTLNNVFHYFSLQQLISKNKNLNKNNLVHFFPTIIMVIVAFFFFKPLYPIHLNSYESLVETQHINYIDEKNYVFYIFRVAHPLIYLLLGGNLLYSFYKSARYQSTQKSTRLFIFFLYFQKVIVFTGLLISLI